MMFTFAHTFEYGDLLHHSVDDVPSVRQRGQWFNSVAIMLATYFRVWPIVWTLWPIYRHSYSIALFFAIVALSLTTVCCNIEHNDECGKCFGHYVLSVQHIQQCGD
jgi:hypothetical protein